MGRIAIGDMALGVRDVGAQLVRGFKLFIEEFPALEGGKITGSGGRADARFIHGFLQLLRGAAHGFAGKQRLAGAGGCA